MARETMEIGATPCEEECEQMGDNYRSDVARHECRTYINQLYRFLESKGFKREEMPDTFSLVVKSNPHDFGSYLEVACKLDPDSEVSYKMFYLIDGEGPTTWDDVAKGELKEFLAKRGE